MAGRDMTGITTPRGGLRRRIAILDLLHWAFARECARLELGDDDLDAMGYGYASSTAAIIRHEQLGCRIDGGGSSPCHPDADVVAAAVAALPEGCGGYRMAVWVADLARTGQVPDSMADARVRCEPIDWQCNRHGWRAKSELIGHVTVAGRGDRFYRSEVRVCPVTYSPTAQQIASARRAYLGWWGALLELRETFRLYGGLTAWEVTEAMPPRTPWKKCLTKS